jgi:hypothetical protein|tara:strand:+ start:511 stop:735 length:225 start_codon:yes stop_codon:yes gene_type:complete
VRGSIHRVAHNAHNARGTGDQEACNTAWARPFLVIQKQNRGHAREKFNPHSIHRKKTGWLKNDQFSVFWKKWLK